MPGPVDENVQHIWTASFDLRDGPRREMGVVDPSRPQAGVSPHLPVRVASAEVALGAGAYGVEILRTLGEGIRGLEASGRTTDASEAIPVFLVEIGGCDCGILWAVEGDCLKPVSAAFADRTKPSSTELTWLAWSRPCLQEFGLQPAAAVTDADLAATGTLGSGGPLERALGPLSYAIAAVASRSHPTFLLQAINLQRRLAQPDLDLLLSFAELSDALIIESRTTALLRRCREWAQAGEHTAADHTAAGLTASDAPNLPSDHAIDLRLKKLTVREREVLAHALTGAPYHTIADTLAITDTTVKSHMNSILHKLDVPSRAQLIARSARSRR